MLAVRLAAGAARPTVLAFPVDADAVLDTVATTARLAEECASLREQTAHTGRAGQVAALPRPLERPRLVLLVGIGDGGPAGWRAAGAGVARAAARETSLTVALPAQAPPQAVAALVEGLRLGSYRFRLGADDPARAPRLRQVTVAVDDPDRYAAAVQVAQVVTDYTALARDLTNMPSIRKTPAWFSRRIERAAAGLSGVTLRVRDVEDLRREGFGGILAVGGGSANPPRLLELAWRPRGARTHVVLVGKGITFDTGGLSIKPNQAMTLMRKDMAGAAAVAAATLAAAALRLPVRVTGLAALAENMPSGSAMRPGDVVTHWGGRTSEIRNTDAEGRLVLADALAYAAGRLRPDYLVDLATLTGANAVALGRRTGALYSDDPALAEALVRAATDAGEQVWRMPLPDDYLESLRGDVGDLLNSAEGAGSVLGALYLREFTGAARDRWAHIDMSAPSWTDRDHAELTRGATGWGVRTLVRWLRSVADQR
ncbi:MAG TPA: leucyl aminopeptidase family protein [Natronosporangium sp.]|nr:leucyl aminopeptidase family protein [Natronosporangium sp.]